MAVIALDPTLFADSISDATDDPRYEHIAITGINELGKVDIYALILETLEGTGIRYGHMINPNLVVMSDDHLRDYLAELASSILEMTDSDELSYEDELEALDEIYASALSGFEDESEAFRRTEERDGVVDLESVLSDFLQSALEDSTTVLTGGYREIQANILLV